MRATAEVVRRFHERMQARDWDGAGELLSPELEVRWTASGERFVGPAFLAMQRAYPEGWTIHVHEVLADGDRVASQVRVEQGGATYWCAGFATVRDGVIVDLVEHWLTEGADPPPGWRAAFSAPA